MNVETSTSNSMNVCVMVREMNGVVEWVLRKTHSPSSSEMVMVAWTGSPLMAPMLAAGWGISSVMKKFSSNSKTSSFTIGMLKFALVALARKRTGKSLPL